MNDGLGRSWKDGTQVCYKAYPGICQYGVRNAAEKGSQDDCSQTKILTWDLPDMKQECQPFGCNFQY